MSMKQPPRVWVSNENPQAGDILRVRAQIEHPMETGLRTDPATGVMHRSVLKPLGAPSTGRTFCVLDSLLSEVTIHPAIDAEPAATVTVMPDGGEVIVE